MVYNSLVRQLCILFLSCFVASTFLLVQFGNAQDKRYRCWLCDQKLSHTEHQTYQEKEDAELRRRRMEGFKPKRAYKTPHEALIGHWRGSNHLYIDSTTFHMVTSEGGLYGQLTYMIHEPKLQIDGSCEMILELTGSIQEALIGVTDVKHISGNYRAEVNYSRMRGYTLSIHNDPKRPIVLQHIFSSYNYVDAKRFKEK